MSQMRKRKNEWKKELRVQSKNQKMEEAKKGIKKQEKKIV
jgi:hypothetical protein